MHQDFAFPRRPQRQPVVVPLVPVAAAVYMPLLAGPLAFGLRAPGIGIGQPKNEAPRAPLMAVVLGRFPVGFTLLQPVAMTKLINILVLLLLVGLVVAGRGDAASAVDRDHFSLPVRVVVALGVGVGLCKLWQLMQPVQAAVAAPLRLLASGVVCLQVVEHRGSTTTVLVPVAGSITALAAVWLLLNLKNFLPG